MIQKYSDIKDKITSETKIGLLNELESSLDIKLDLELKDVIIDRDNIVYFLLDNKELKFITLDDFFDNFKKIVLNDNKFVIHHDKYKIELISNSMLGNIIHKKLATTFDNAIKLKFTSELYPFIKDIGLIDELPSFLTQSELLGFNSDDFPDDTQGIVYITINKDHKIGYTYMTLDSFKEYFPKINVINGNPYAASHDSKFRFPIPIESPLGNIYYSESIKTQLYTLKNKIIVPTELLNKYCVCHSGKIIDSSDSFIGAKNLQIDKYSTLSTQILIPKNHYKYYK